MEIENIESKAYQMGAFTYQNIDALEDFYQKIIRYLLFGNILKNNTYPLSVSAERIIQAIEIVNYAKKIGAQYIAHGSTGAGNDQAGHLAGNPPGKRMTEAPTKRVPASQAAGH